MPGMALRYLFPPAMTWSAASGLVGSVQKMTTCENITVKNMTAARVLGNGEKGKTEEDGTNCDPGVSTVKFGVRRNLICGDESLKEREPKVCLRRSTV